MTGEINIFGPVLCAYQISSVDYDLLPTVTTGRVMDVRIETISRSFSIEHSAERHLL